MGAKDVRAGGAYVEIGAITKGLDKGLAAAAAKLKAFGQAVGSIGRDMLKLGGGILAPLSAAAKVFADMGSELNDASQRTGVAVEALSGLAYAAKLSGSNLEGLEGGIRKMQKTITEAAQGSDTAQEALARLGVEFDSIKNLAPDEQFKVLAEAISKVQDPTQRAGLAMGVFGKGAAELLPLMSEGRAGIDQMLQKASELGLVWSTEDASAADELGDTLDTLWAVMKKGVAVIGGAVAPIFKEFATRVSEAIASAAKWINANRGVVQAALAIGAAIAVAGAAFVVLGSAISAIGAVVGSIGSVLAVGLGGLGAYLVATSETGRTALKALAGYFGDLKDTALSAFQGIKDALAAGDWALAAKILWTGLKLAWAEGIAPLKTAWVDFQKFFVDTASNTWAGVLAGFELAADEIIVVWTHTIAALKDIFDGFKTTVANGFGSVVGALFKTVASVAPNTKLGKASDIVAEGIPNILAAREKDDADAAVAREKDKNAKLEAERKRHAAALEKIAADSQALKGGAATNAEQEREAIRREIEAQKKELARVTEQARNEANAAAGNKPDAKPKIPNAADIGEGIFKSISVAGTFSAFGAGQLGPQRSLDRIAKATEDTAKQLRKKDMFGNPVFK